MSVITRATAEQKAKYLETKPCYPLYGFMKVDGIQLVIEDLRGHWDNGDPQYEVCAPKGYIFSESGTHKMLEHRLSDIRQNAPFYAPEKCEPGCSCGFDHPARQPSPTHDMSM